MASLSNAVVCALIATAFWSLSYALARRLVPRVLALGAAPVIGWSVHSAVTLPIYLLFGFSSFVVIGIGSACILVAALSLLQPSAAREAEPLLTIPVWGFAPPASSPSFPQRRSCQSRPEMRSGSPTQSSTMPKSRSSMR